MKETETSMMKTMETKTQCAMKQRGKGLLSPVFGNSKINEKIIVYFVLAFIFLITGSVSLLKFIWVILCNI